MDDGPTILLTNDDGIDSPGLKALYDELSSIGSVVAVAPTEDQSSVGRSVSGAASVSEHEFGYAIDGTPADCVIAGLKALAQEADIVVSGCNSGANIGEYVLGRSGTVSAAIEATYFERPAIAVSQYIPVAGDASGYDFEFSIDEFAEAARVTTYLIEHAVAAGVFEECDFLNVNVPAPDVLTGGMVVTRPSHVHHIDAHHESGTIKLADHVWKRMREGTVSDPPGTDRRAILDGKISVSPLTAPHATERHEALDELADRYSSME